MSQHFTGGQVLSEENRVAFYFASEVGENPTVISMSYDPMQPTEAFVSIAERMAKEGLPGHFQPGEVVPISFERYQQLIV